MHDAAVVPVALRSLLQNVAQVGEAFVVLRSDGRVVAWGSAIGGGDTSSVDQERQLGVLYLSSSNLLFAAVKANGKLVMWGYGSLWWRHLRSAEPDLCRGGGSGLHLHSSVGAEE